MRVHPLKHSDYRGLILSDIDERTLHLNTPTGIKLF